MDSKIIAPQLGTVEFALLGLLAETPMNGYDVQKRFEFRLSGAWSAGYSQIYPGLAKLERAGYIEILETGSRGSKIYGATEAGVAAMRAWLHDEVTRTARNESALRMFFYWMLEPSEALERLRAEEAYHKGVLEGYRALLPIFPENPEPSIHWTRIMLERAIRFEIMMLEWIEWAAGEATGMKKMDG